MNDQFSRSAACPLCASKVTFQQSDLDYLVTCQTCGKVGMTFELSVDWDMQGTPHPYLSAATRKASEAGIPLTLTMENWQRLEEGQRSIRVSQKLTDLLRLIAIR